MEWVKSYYTAQSRTFGRAVVSEKNRAVAGDFGHWCRERGEGKRVLELGAGAGGMAAAMADLGYDVWAVEFNPSCASLARELVSGPRAGCVHVVEEDFYTATFETPFDLVYYWDGFGIGSDADQQRLLQRIASEWLAPHGWCALDVFSPWNWARRAGERSTHTALDGTTWERRADFDASASRLIDAWRPADRPDVEPRSQTIRCYTLLELVRLLEGTGLRLDRVYGMDGRRIDPEDPSPVDEAYLRETNGYLAHLVPA